jgi:magnesium chelatase subunit ChlD-like protein
MRSGFRWREGAGDATRDGTSGARIAWPRTLAAKRDERLRPDHLRYVREEARGGVLHCFVLDCSGSMMSGQKLARAKGLLVAMFDQARAARADVALVCFGGDRADVRFGPAAPRWWNQRWIEPIGGGGGTPLILGVEAASTLLERVARRRPAQQRWLWVFSDGRSSGMPARPAHADHVVIVDFEQERTRIGRCAELAREWSGEWLPFDALMGA